MLSCSEASTSGNFQLHYENSHDYEEYSFVDETWLKKRMPQPTKREAEILTYLKHGMSVKEIAQKLGITNSTLTHEISALKLKYGVKNNILHLIIYATNNSLLS
ncbi:MAG: LuxR C-terminal-related transcriptional regulator [Prevotellaceae bacterium]|jgi:DNA-binding NarL/FixJ family response regulator|nr:LuxR C-terminal-related transcriptional regulator [Prevotellaceae bacterium]